jgi:hypothetical protein
MPESLEAAVKHADSMETCLREFLKGSLSRPEFLDVFREALNQYKNVVNSRPYYPLEDIVDSWPKSDQQLKELCSQAVERLPRELLDRSTRQWIADNLVLDESFSFANPDETSKFGASLVLYRTGVERQSFLLSAINGSLRPAPFKYEALLQTLRALAGEQLATWALCSEPDGALAIIDSVWSLGPTFEEPEQLSQLERIRGDHVQWGNCYLLLIPADRTWLLVNHYNFSELRIELHADAVSCKRVANVVGLEWGADA